MYIASKYIYRSVCLHKIFDVTVGSLNNTLVGNSAVRYVHVVPTRIGTPAHFGSSHKWHKNAIATSNHNTGQFRPSLPFPSVTNIPATRDEYIEYTNASHFVDRA